MPKFKNGLAKVGDVYYFAIKVGGKPYHGSTGMTDKVDAQIWLAEKKRRLRAISGNITEPTLEDVLFHWLEHVGKSMSKGHADAMRRKSAHFGDLLNRKVSTITTKQVLMMRTRYLDDGGSIGGANAVIRYLNILGGHAVKVFGIGAVPWDVKPAKMQRVRKPVIHYSKMGLFLEEVDRQGSRTSKHIPVMARLMIGLGLRHGEAVAARWEGFDLKSDPPTYTPPRTKGMEAKAIPIPEWLAVYLRELPWRKSYGYCFPGRAGKEHRSAHFGSKCIREAAERAGIHGITPHRLRGTFATILNASGSGLVTIQQLMRHKDVRMPLEYIEESIETEAAAVRRAAELMKLQNGYTESNNKPDSSS